MAQRHEIQNLVRRGHIFYWRARIPRRFARIAEGHISLSLQQSCHMKAGYMARRLNTLLHEMKMKPVAALTTKQQLEALFRIEAARMGEHLDNLQFAGRRVGSDPLLALRADLEVGWAYRLIELFGTMRQLDFGPDCPGRKRLAREGIPAASIAVIADTFVQEQAECRSAPFEKALRADMAEQDIPDTLINRERATAELMRARADMLLSSASRYPEAEGLALTDILGSDDPSMADAAADNRVNGSPKAPSSAAPNLRESDLPAPASLARSAEPGRTTQASDQPAAVTQPMRAEPTGQAVAEPPAVPNHAPSGPVAHGSPRPEGQPLAVSEFDRTCEALIQSKRTWEAKTAQDVRVVVGTFAAILAEYGVSDVSEIQQFHVGRLREHFDQIPTGYGQSARMRKLTPKQLREVAARQIEAAKELRKEPPKVGLGTNTIRKHLGNLAEFFRYLRGHGYALRELSIDGLRPPKLKASDVRTLTEKPDPERLRPMFTIPVFTGCRDAENQGVPGERVFHSANFFAPMLLTYLGARRNEITGLATDDIVETPKGWGIHIRMNEFRRVKNVQSIRLLPVPDEVMRLGFAAYVQAIRELGYPALFPELFNPQNSNDHGDRLYDDFRPLVEVSNHVAIWDRFLHALRHGHSDTLKQLGVSPEIISDISGRLNKSETSVRYTNAAGLPLIREKINLYPKITEHLEPRSLQLLPWVENRQPAPWTQMTQGKRLEYARAVRAEKAAKRNREK